MWVRTEPSLSHSFIHLSSFTYNPPSPGEEEPAALITQDLTPVTLDLVAGKESIVSIKCKGQILGEMRLPLSSQHGRQKHKSKRSTQGKKTYSLTAPLRSSVSANILCSSLANRFFHQFLLTLRTNKMGQKGAWLPLPGSLLSRGAFHKWNPGAHPPHHS